MGTAKQVGISITLGAHHRDPIPLFRHDSFRKIEALAKQICQSQFSQKVFIVLPTEEIYHEAVVVAVDVRSRIRLKLDGHIGCRGEESKSRKETAVLTQDVGRQVVPIIKGEQIISSQTKTNRNTHAFILFNTLCLYLYPGSFLGELSL